MLDIDWRSPEAYAHARDIPPAGFAWEYLRRDRDYQWDFVRINADVARPRDDVLDAFSRRWGLRFPRRSESSGR
ncbi:transcriptional regulator domain-containing protein [Pinisolibacter aquiterrae]|uniref:transcriptional regulator domain-containing protein n=1 Tax=Pinisolibacter aquiterrae TaxID=2815579 RepID=UPI001E416476|nr:DUF6499 domain-containing protein [Pinisolibacter aquiterrae]MCC8234742.1 DUF6499 domain-containing protein [Pinisolibacter aquiterrae]